MDNEAPAVGDPAPRLRLPALAGDVYDLSSAKGHFVVVSFLRHAG